MPIEPTTTAPLTSSETPEELDIATFDAIFNQLFSTLIFPSKELEEILPLAPEQEDLLRFPEDFSIWHNELNQKIANFNEEPLENASLFEIESHLRDVIIKKWLGDSFFEELEKNVSLYASLLVLPTLLKNEQVEGDRDRLPWIVLEPLLKIKELTLESQTLSKEMGSFLLAFPDLKKLRLLECPFQSFDLQTIKGLLPDCEVTTLFYTKLEN